MRSLSRLAPLILIFLACGCVHAAPKTKVSLLLEAEVIKPGETILAAVELEMPDKWHTYWRTGGDSGSATRIEWTLPTYWKAGEIMWPVPEKLETEGLFTYIYHTKVLLLVPIQTAKTTSPGTYELKAKVSWLECDRSCLQGRGEVQARLEVGSERKPGKDASVISEAAKRIPTADSVQKLEARLEPGPDADNKTVIFEWKNGKGNGADFFPYKADDVDLEHKSVVAKGADGAITIRKSLKKSGAAWPTSLSGLVVPEDKSVVPFEAVVSLGQGGPSPATAPAPVPAAGAQPLVEQRTLLGALLLAFLGGLILNVMPCVLPVIALKIFGFVNQGRDNPARIRKMGLVYGAGVLFSFLVLAGLVIVVRHAGKAASWGMQFQNPIFLVVMTVVVTLVALNLFGLFEITLDNRTLGAAGQLASKEGYPGAFFNGVLATALGTPCTAPFLSLALGFAFAQPSYVTILIFLTVGLGLASPYVLLSFQPSWLKFLPKPGPWMGRFKVAMGFPMLGTALWLFTLTTPNYGPSAPLWLGIFLVLLALGAWMWGEFVQRSESRRGLGALITLLLLGGSYVWILEKELHWRSKQEWQVAGGGVQREPGGIEWEKWSPEAVAKAREEGRPVLVDFTADWCAICQVNKRRALEIASVRTKLKEIGAVALLADYTREDPAITAELARFGRAAVPLVLIYPVGRNAEPILLPELLQPGDVLGALGKAGSKQSKISQK